MEQEQFAKLKTPLEKIAVDIGRIADSMTAPKSVVQKVIDFLLAMVGIGGGVAIADQIIRWIRGVI
jgi:hypothetical protein